MMTSRINFNFVLPALLLVLGLGACGPEETLPPPAVERAAPQVLLFQPLEAQQLSTASAAVSGRVVAEAGVAGLGYQLNGGEAVALPVEEGRSEQGFDVVVEAREGDNLLVVTVRDTEGREATGEVRFVRRTPLRPGALTAAGGSHSGTVRDGVLYTWGRNNRGQLGLGNTTDGKSPVKVAGLTDVATVSFSQNSSMVIKTDGTVWAWGENNDGQLGLGSPTTPDVAVRTTPVQVPGITDAVAGAMGFSHALVLHKDGHLSAFGKNNAGQLGDGTTTDRSYPVPVTGLSDVLRVIAASQHSAALLRDGTVWVWGRNTYGNLGTGAADTTSHPKPTQVPGLTGVVDIANGRDHILALHADGSVSAWGLNASGQLGDGQEGASSQRATPAPVKNITGALAVFAQGNMSFALLRDGTLWGWGQNFNGQLGIGDTTAQPLPTSPVVLQVKPQEPLRGLIDVTPGATHVIARHQDGTVYAWGWSFAGSLGGGPALTDRWSYTLPLRVALP